ncbi:TetR family transcriptional regulator [Streptomyces sp. NPDC046985]|uniref:TetR family transcriptional regulator n=1 Tax=Streptomyces sp. NPDC046985 TaxID=3155377 RepID=UPI0033E65435
MTEDPPRRSKAEQSAATRAKLLDAAVEEFQRYGLAGGRVDRIAQMAGVNKRQIYVYYGDKEGLFDAVLVRDVETMIDDVPLRGDDLAAYALSLYDYLRERPTVSRLLSWRNLERQEASEIEYDAYRRKVEVVAQAQRSLAPDSAHDPADVLVLILGLVQAWTFASPALREIAEVDDPSREDRRRRSLCEAVSRLITPRDSPGE